MSTEWYYTNAGQQIGPVSGDQIKQMAADGALGADELVWNQSMTEWVAARRVKGLAFGGGSISAGDLPAEPVPPAAAATPAMVQTTLQHAPVPSQSLAYEAPGAESCQVTARTLDLLRLTRPWVLMMTVLMFIGVGLMLLGSLGMFIMGATGGSKNAAIGFGLGSGYLVATALFCIPPFFLAKYSSRISNLLRLRRAVDLEQALEAQKSYWKCLGIMTIAFVSLYVIGIVVMIVMSIRGVRL